MPPDSGYDTIVAKKEGAKAPSLTRRFASLEVINHTPHDRGQNDRRGDYRTDGLDCTVHLSPDRVGFNDYDNRQANHQCHRAHRHNIL